MTEVFISYASEDRDRAGKLASALGALGWSVWWDRKIITGQPFDRIIERELETAKCIVVLWSKHSIASEWVKNEASVASERGVLVPATIDRVKLPLEFRRRQTADLADWKGEPSHSGFQALCEGVSTTIGGPQRRQPIQPRRQHARRSPRGTLAAIAAVVLAVGLGVYSMGPWRTTTPTPVFPNDRSANNDPSESRKSPGAAAELADLVVGSYSGDVIADSTGGARTHIGLTITRLDGSTVRVASDDPGLGTVDVALTRIGNQILNAGGDTPFMVDLDLSPLTVLFDPRSEVAYRGTRQE